MSRPPEGLRPELAVHGSALSLAMVASPLAGPRSEGRSEPGRTTTGPSLERSSLVLLDDDGVGQGDVTTSCLWSIDTQRRGGGAIAECAASSATIMKQISPS